MTRPSARSPEARFPALWAAAGALEFPIGCLVLGLKSPVPLAGAALLHLAAAGLMFVAPPGGEGRLDSGRHWAQAAGLWTLCLPGVGWVLICALKLANPTAGGASSPHVFEEEDQEEDEEAFVPVATEEETSRRLMAAVDVVPAADILVGPDPALKRGAIETLARIRTPEAIRWLLQSRRDPNPEVRFYATSALTNLKSEYEQRIRAAELEIFEKPTEPAPQLVYCRIDYEFAMSGLVEGSTRELILGKCRSWLKDLSERDDSALRLHYLVEKELDPPKALAMLSTLIARLPEEGLRWRKEAAALLFTLGRYAEVAQRMKSLGPGLLAEADGPLTPEGEQWKSAVLWWTS
ncbi:MAG: HEAT repeat domain-containing protein [Elusimicrobia bacterium]|nr:HEAT repeat domain-containing protein [Elusimicrobiota bacterium]